MAAALADALQPLYFGAHFFDPSRSMHLLELIPASFTDPRLMGVGVGDAPWSTLLARSPRAVKHRACRSVSTMA